MAPVHLLAILMAAGVVIATPVEPKAKAAEDYRLPQIYDITSYKLELAVGTDSFTNKNDSYTGKVTIQFQFTKATNFIALHADSDYLTIKSVKFNNIKLQDEDYSINKVTDILKINLVNPIITKEKYDLIIEYVGRLSTTDMYGFYKSSYVDTNGKTKYLATTQFETTYARRAFPCFDEPSFKAVFKVSIKYPKDLSVLFNTKSTNTTTDKDGVTTTVFADTPKMSTYLLAFIISEFTCTSGGEIDTVTYQVCSRKETADLRNFALQVGQSVLAVLNELTGYKYSLNMKKMDEVAIPDFAPGAMENWGLITYRETDLLFNENESSNKYKQNIATVIAHESSHQWFGDLVTCGWWSETFLNEGFATYFEYHVAHALFPDWELDKQYVIEVIHSVLDVDEQEKTPALQSDCSTPTEIGNKFDDISYYKGGSILRMVSLFMGHNNFFAGLRLYLVNNAFTGAKPERLWEALGSTVDNTIANLPTDLPTIMENWVKKPGFPLLTVSLVNNSIVVTQERFMFGASDNETQWYVPITYTTSNDGNKFESTSPAYWLAPKNNVTFDYPLGTTWVILNNQESAYYRVNYDDTLWHHIRTGLKQDNFDGIGEINRAQIVDDVFSMAKIGRMSYTNVFDTTEFLVNDNSYYPWYAALQGYGFLLRRVGQNSKLGQAISASLLSLMKNLYQSVPINKLNDTQQIYTLKQVLALTWACNLGEEGCVKDTKALFNQYKASEIRPDKNLRSIVYCNGLRYSDSETDDWNFLWEAYKKSADLATERGTIITTLGCTKNTTLLEEYLQKTITDNSGIRKQDAATVFSAVYTGSQEGVDVAYSFLTNNYKEIADKYQSMNSLGNIIKGIAERFTTEEEITKLKNFTTSDDLPEEFKTAATQALQVAQSNQNWLKQYQAELTQIFVKEADDAAFKVGASSLVVLLVAVITMVFVS